MRARQPDSSGYAVNDGVRIYYEVHGQGSPTVVLMPTWSIVHSRMWKMQVPYLARHYRVVTFDARGNGLTDRPDADSAYDADRIADDAAAVMDATGTDAAVFVAFCTGTVWTALLHQRHPGKVLGLVAIGSPLTGDPAPFGHRHVESFDEVLDGEEGWDKENRHYWKKDWPGYVRFFAGEMFTEPHSTKPFEDIVGWGLETDAVTMLHDQDSRCGVVEMSLEQRADLCRGLDFPILAIQGAEDRITPPQRSVRLAELTGCDLLMLAGAGHVPHARHPVVVNHAIKDFVDRVVPPAPKVTPWLFARDRKRKALWISSPIGLGHVLRDLAIARQLRERVPDLQIEWWAQPPVTDVLRSAGEIIHPASQELSSESEHWESEAGLQGDHDLHAFYAFRRMDEILLANYMLFDEVVRQTPYDLWVGDESWEVDHFLHENPERKIAPYAFTTDVVGFLPVDPEGDPHEAELTADYNAEMIEHRARHPRVRDLSLFLGSAAELPSTPMGPGLPGVRAWAQDWFEMVPYVVPFDPREYRDTAALRERFGYAQDVPLLGAAVGGTAVGRHLLDLVAEGFAHLRKEVPEARMVMITGPRISPSDITDVEGLVKHAYLDDAFGHLACADAAVVQGGLSTTMELVAAGRPFLYFPLARHWEQQKFVAHRLDHYHAGTRLDHASTTPGDLAQHLLAAMKRKPRYRAVPRDGAGVAARRIASLLTR